MDCEDNTFCLEQLGSNHEFMS